MKEALDELQGTWNVVTLEVDGVTMQEAAFKGSKIEVEGESFNTVSMVATYIGTLKIDVSKNPKTLDLLFTEGPE